MSDFFGSIVADSKDVSLSVLMRSIVDGTELIGLGANDVTISYWRQGGIPVQIPAIDLAGIDSFHVDGGWREADPTIQKGMYRLDPPDEAVASGADWVVFSVETSEGLNYHERFTLETREEALPSAGTLDTGLANSYVSVEGANNYFATRLNTDSWDTASSTNQLKSLQQATRMIDRLNFKGAKIDPENQQLEFPRIIEGIAETDIPDDVKIACCEIALKLLEGTDPDMDLDAMNVTSETFSSVKATYNRQIIPDYLRNGIPSALAWSYLRPYLVDIRVLTFTRAN